MSSTNKSNNTYLVTGASSGLGEAVAEKLLINGNSVILTARTEKKFKELSSKYPNQVVYYIGDVNNAEFINQLIQSLPSNLIGAFINAGGPPAATFEESSLEDWDLAYKLLVRWKIQLVKGLLPILQKNKKGRVLFSESNSITRPIKNLVLSNSMRMVIIGLSKTLVLEYPKSGITFNILAPGSHDTKALDRLYDKLCNQKGIAIKEAKEIITAAIPTGKTGSPSDYASLAQWILTGPSDFLTGQVVNIDGGTSV